MPDKYGITAPPGQTELTRVVGVPDPWVSSSPITTQEQTRTERITIHHQSTLHLPAIQRPLVQGIKYPC